MPTPSGLAKEATVTQVRDAVLGLAVPKALRLDYDVRTDKQPVYLGRAAYASAVEGDPVWTVTRFTYESAVNDARLVDTAVQVNIAWDDRATGW